MKSDEKSDNSQEYFNPLNSFRYNTLLNPSVANNKQMVLAKNLHRSYHIPEGNILRLIIYTDIALHETRGKERKLYYSDLSVIGDFGKTPAPIEKIVFMGKGKSFELTSPYLIDKLYHSLPGLLDLRNTGKEKSSGKKPASLAIIKRVATELYTELTDKEKITGSKPLYIIGYIFSLYNVGLKKEEAILTEKEFKAQLEKKKSEGITSPETYLQYLGRRIKPFVNWKVVKELR